MCGNKSNRSLVMIYMVSTELIFQSSSISSSFGIKNILSNPLLMESSSRVQSQTSIMWVSLLMSHWVGSEIGTCIKCLFIFVEIKQYLSRITSTMCFPFYSRNLFPKALFWLLLHLCTRIKPRRWRFSRSIVLRLNLSTYWDLSH